MLNWFKNLVNKKEQPKYTASITMTSGYTKEVQSTLEVATAFKKEKKFLEACLTLETAYDLAKDSIHLKDRLRLPMYLQLAKKNDEGWKEISFLFATRLDAQSQYIIANQIRIFLQKEKRHLPAVPYGIYAICKEIDYLLEQIEKKQYKLENDEYQFQAYLKAEKEAKNYYDGEWENNRILILLEPEFITSQIHKLLKKAKYESFETNLIKEIETYIMGNYKKGYHFLHIHKICEDILIKS